MAIIAHLSDIHFGRVDPVVIAALADAINALAPDLVAVSGDLTQRARRHQFLAAQQFLDRLPRPLLVVPGNHDVPLFNLAARFSDPFGNYQRFIQSELEPSFQCDSFVAIGLNSARTVPFSGAGRLNEQQVERAALALEAAPSGAIKIIVTHHPFDVPDTHGEEHIVGRSGMAMRRLADAGADLFLAGHLHVSHVGHTAARYEIADYSALVVQAGTMSTRHRGELNTFNVLRLGEGWITVERFSWDEPARRFAPTWSQKFQRGHNGWF